MEPLIAMKGGTTEKAKRRREESMVNQEGVAAGMLRGLTFLERSVSEPPWKEYPRQCSVSWGLLPVICPSLWSWIPGRAFCQGSVREGGNDAFVRSAFGAGGVDSESPACRAALSDFAQVYSTMGHPRPACRSSVAWPANRPLESRCG
jgi:hypothetical protein